MSYGDARPSPADVSYDEDSAWCQSHGHGGLLAGSVCGTCDRLVATDPRFAAVLGTVHNPDGTLTDDGRAVAGLRDGARMVRNLRLAGLCTDALHGDAGAWQRVTEIAAGRGDPAAAVPPPIAAALAEVDRAMAELDAARDAGADTRPARAVYDAAYAALRTAYDTAYTSEEDPR